MSAGRVVLGLGAGWCEPEHCTNGIPFPPPAERFDRLDEQLTIIKGLWTTPAGSTFSYRGRYYQLEQSPALPKPVQQPPRRSSSLAAVPARCQRWLQRTPMGLTKRTMTLTLKHRRTPGTHG